MIPADRPYVGLLVIKIFPAYLLSGRSEALQRQRPKTRNIGHIYQWSDGASWKPKQRCTKLAMAPLGTTTLRLLTTTSLLVSRRKVVVPKGAIASFVHLCLGFQEAPSDH